MRTDTGEQVNTVFGVASMLLQILKTEQPDSLLFCFDADEKTFRHIEYPEYKAGRATTPDDFYTQIPRSLEMIDSFGIKSVSGNAYEADDYACSYARKAEAAGYKVTIVTGDRDLFQLSSENIRVAIPHKGYQVPEYMSPEAIFTKYGVQPSQIPAYKGLVGDSSDNLPGVKGIGPKAAESLLQQYGTLEAVYENISLVKPAWRSKLEQGREQAFFCQKMARLHCDIALPIPLEELRFSEVLTSRIIDFFTCLHFTLISKRFTQFLETPYGKAHFLIDRDLVLSHAQDLGRISPVTKKESVEDTQLSLL